MKFKIEEMLKRRNKSKIWLSQMTNITPSNIGKICKGENKSIKINTIDKICTALDCDISDILENEPHTKTLQRLRVNQNDSILASEMTELISEYGSIENLKAYLDQQKRS